jgi:ketosteroid isomerase-like protein
MEEEKMKFNVAIKGFYSAVNKFDYETMRTFCTENFHNVEDGHVFNNLDDFIEMFKFLEGAESEMDMDFVQTDVAGNYAFSIVKFDANYKKGSSQWHFKTIENYILKKSEGKWKIDFFLSTHLPDDSDKKYTSIHLLKIPDELLLAALEDEIRKGNAIVAEKGYPECGYMLTKIHTDNKSSYNYVLFGNFKNLQTYDIIHDEAEFKKSADQATEILIPYFKDELYVKTSLP